MKKKRKNQTQISYHRTTTVLRPSVISGTDLTGEERRITYSSDFHLGAVNGHWSGHSVDDDWDSSASTLASDRSVAAAAIAVGGVYFLAIF